MRFTYDFAVKKLNELINFAQNSESAINDIQENYSNEKQELENKWNSEVKRLRRQAEADKITIERKADSMLKEALQISGEILSIERMLLIKDKYYKKTKSKKENELRGEHSNGYDSNNDYFQILDNIRNDFERISRKYRENILPGIINGIHYFFSSKRKAEYEELIVLKNTVTDFIDEIRDNINEIRNAAINQIDQEFHEKYKKLQTENRKSQEQVEYKRVMSIAELTEVISDTLDIVFPKEIVRQMDDFISEYQDSLNKIFDKKLGTSSFLSLFCIYLSVNKISESETVYKYIIEKLKKLILNTEEGDFLLIPALSYFDKNSNWYFRWDNHNREFIHQKVCDLMYSIITKVPVGHLCFDIVDPISRGENIRSYYDARTKIPELFSERIFFNSADIDNHLNDISNYIDYISQRILGTKYNSIFEYADVKEDFIPDVKYLVIFDFPKGMSEVSVEMLSNIVNQGSKCGVFVIIAETYDEMDIRRSSLFLKNLSDIKNMCQYITTAGERVLIKNQTVILLAEMPDRQAFNNYIDRYLLIRESICNKGLVFPNMIKPLILSNNMKEIEKQIDNIVAFSNTMNECNCFNVEKEIEIPKAIGIGTVQYPIDLFEDSCAYELITKEFAQYSNFATLPFSVDLDEDLNIMILSNEEEVLKAIEFSHHILWSFFSAIPAGAFNVCIIDIEGHGKNVVPFLDFCSQRLDIFNGGVLSTHEQLREQLKMLIQRIDNISFKRLGSKYQNIHEYNRDNENAIEPITLLVVYDFMKILSFAELTEIQKIIQNGSRCGIYTLLCGTELLENEKRDAVKMGVLDSLKKICTILEPVEKFFRLVPFNVMLQPRKQLTYFQKKDFVEKYIDALEIMEEKTKNKAPENDYTILFDLEHPPVYTRGNKNLHLPYGISADGELYYCDFEKENFAAFLCGSSGSGKSTLIHALITGILVNNHPDDVELWLADFKMKEFRRYVANRPPHIKYILLEESRDAVYDFLDRMEAKLTERERLSSKYTDLAKTPVSQYMPLIFVIIDEFSVMSQIIDQNETYKLILQNLLAKGRALGFRFLFSSQTFTTGITGLSATAKKQIQMRLAMKNPQEEIAETIDMSKALMSEEQKRWLLTLPKYYILLKKIVGEGSTVSNGKVQDEVVLTRAKGLYFPDEEYDAQNKYIKLITNTYVKKDRYLPSDIYSYKDKKAVVVDGSVFYSFKDVREDIDEHLRYVKQHDIYSEESIRLFVGHPRSMQKVSEIVVDNEFEENIILFGTNTEFCTSVILSAMASLKYAGSTVSVIGYLKNRVYRRVNETGKKYIDKNYMKEEDICNLIHQIRIAIDNGETGNSFLFILGMDVILKNIQYMEKYSHKHKNSNDFSNEKEDYSNIFDDDDGSIYDKLLTAELSTFGEDEVIGSEKVSDTVFENKMIQKQEKVEIYDIREDLEVILQEGPRFGYHVFAYFRTYDEFKQTKYHFELFKHKITFKCSKDDSRNIISKSTAFDLGQIAFIYTDLQTTFSMRPYLHEGLQWDGWKTDKYGHAIRQQLEGGE